MVNRDNENLNCFDENSINTYKSNVCNRIDGDNVEEGQTEEVKKIVRPQDEIPPEAELKMLARRYDRLHSQMKSLIEYSKGLENEKVELQHEIVNLNKKLEEYSGMVAENKLLQGKLKTIKHEVKNVYPKQLLKQKRFTTIILSLRNYVSYLQYLLRKHGIAFKERTPFPSHPLEGLSDEELLSYAKSIHFSVEDFENQQCDE